MRRVTGGFKEAMKASVYKVSARAIIDYTDPTIDQTIAVTVNEEAGVSYPNQTFDGVTTTPRKWASMDGSCTLDGSYHMTPDPGDLAQFGWWGRQLADESGDFALPCPTLTVTHLARPIHRLQVVGDSARGEYPADFEIRMYASDDTLLKTHSVVGNDEVFWSETLFAAMLDVARQELEITKWSHPGRQVKIVEFFTSIQETYLEGDLVGLRFLEEREASQGSLPVGNISANELTLAFANQDGKFDMDNEQSPLHGVLKPNRRVRAWLGIDGGGDGVDVKQQVDLASGTHTRTKYEGGELVLDDPGGPAFARASVAYNPDTDEEVAAHEPRFVTGGLVLEEETENLLSVDDVTWDLRYGLYDPTEILDSSLSLDPYSVLDSADPFGKTIITGLLGATTLV